MNKIEFEFPEFTQDVSATISDIFRLAHTQQSPTISFIGSASIVNALIRNPVQIKINNNEITAPIISEAKEGQITLSNFVFHAIANLMASELDILCDQIKAE